MRGIILSVTGISCLLPPKEESSRRCCIVIISCVSKGLQDVIFSSNDEISQFTPIYSEKRLTRGVTEEVLTSHRTNIGRKTVVSAARGISSS